VRAVEDVIAALDESRHEHVAGGVGRYAASGVLVAEGRGARRAGELAAPEQVARGASELQDQQIVTRLLLERRPGRHQVAGSVEGDRADVRSISLAGQRGGAAEARLP
jgi:sirohydrochlorin ferrochelatase